MKTFKLFESSMHTTVIEDVLSFGLVFSCVKIKKKKKKNKKSFNIHFCLSFFMFFLLSSFGFF